MAQGGGAARSCFEARVPHRYRFWRGRGEGGRRVGDVTSELVTLDAIDGAIIRDSSSPSPPASASESASPSLSSFPSPLASPSSTNVLSVASKLNPIQGKAFISYRIAPNLTNKYIY